MSNVLGMPTFEVRYPMLVLILMETHDLPQHFEKTRKSAESRRRTLSAFETLCERRVRRAARTAVQLFDIARIIGLDVTDSAADGPSARYARVLDDLVRVGHLKDHFRGHKSRIANQVFFGYKRAVFRHASTANRTRSGEPFVVL